MTYRWATLEVSDEIRALERALEASTQTVTSHPVYRSLDSLHRVQKFMEVHVFAVWNFMSLLKALQSHLSCVAVPWLPRGDPGLRRLVNGIVLEEESDETERGVMSHFELYRLAMTEAGADGTALDAFLEYLREGRPLATALTVAGAPRGAQSFVIGDWRIIEAGEIVEIAATFAFGREQVIPEMFTCLRVVAERHPEQLALLLDYLNRHIELDGDVHRPMAMQMVAAVCGADVEKWHRAEVVAEEALKRRTELWDSVLMEW